MSRRTLRSPDDGGGKHLWNVGKLLPDYTAQQPRRQPSSWLNSFSPIIKNGSSSTVDVYEAGWNLHKDAELVNHPVPVEMYRNSHPAKGTQKGWLTLSSGATLPDPAAVTVAKERREGVGWTTQQRKGIWRHQRRKLRWKVRSSHLPPLFTIEEHFWWGESSELRWTNAEGKRHVVLLCDVTGLGWGFLNSASVTEALKYARLSNWFIHTDTLISLP
jgi:hypothetical protein